VCCRSSTVQRLGVCKRHLQEAVRAQGLVEERCAERHCEARLRRLVVQQLEGVGLAIGWKWVRDHFANLQL
jgi:hypothetical protein